MSAHPPERHPDDVVVGAAASSADATLGGVTDAASVVLRAEELRAGVERVATKRVRLRKYVVEEQTTIPLTLRHEVVEVIEEPLSGAEAAAVPGTLGSAAGEPAVIEMIVHREEPRVEVDVVATERIRLTRHVVVEHVEVTRDVARETAEVIDERALRRGVDDSR